MTDLPRRVALFRGNFRHDHCSEVHWAAALEQLGWTVVRLQEDETSARNIVRELHAHAPQLLISVRTWPWPALSEAEWTDVAGTAQQTATTTVGVHLDRLWGLDRQQVIYADPFFRHDHVFTADGAYQAEYEAAGVNHHWWPPGVHGDECYVGRREPQWESYAVGFVGSTGYHREHPHRTEMVAFLQRRYGRRFLRVGDGNPTVRGDLLNRLYATVPVVVGDSLCLRRESDRYWSDRIPETVGRGGFLLHPRVDAAVEAFGDRVQWWEWGDWEGLADLIDHWTHPDMASEVAARKAEGVGWARANCSYAVRWADLLDTLGLGYDVAAVPNRRPVPNVL